VQVLNEATVNCRRKAGMSWEETGAFLGGIRTLCKVEPLTEDTHDVGRALAARYGLSVYDAMIAAAALIAGCDTLLSEDMGDGLLVEGQLRVVNPFAQA
jgi:predicted nucleic acid-binding protein